MILPTWAGIRHIGWDHEHVERVARSNVNVAETLRGNRVDLDHYDPVATVATVRVRVSLAKPNTALIVRVAKPVSDNCVARCMVGSMK